MFVSCRHRLYVVEQLGPRDTEAAGRVHQSSYLLVEVDQVTVQGRSHLGSASTAQANEPLIAQCRVGAKNCVHVDIEPSSQLTGRWQLVCGLQLPGHDGAAYLVGDLVGQTNGAIGVHTEPHSAYRTRTMQRATIQAGERGSSAASL